MGAIFEHYGYLASFWLKSGQWQDTWLYFGDLNAIAFENCLVSMTWGFYLECLNAVPMFLREKNLKDTGLVVLWNELWDAIRFRKREFILENI